MWLGMKVGAAGTVDCLPESGVLTSARWIESAPTSEKGGAPSGPASHLLLCDLASAAGWVADGADQSWTGSQLGDAPALAPAGARGLLINQMDIDTAHEDEFNDWYDTEHVPRLSAVDGVIAARRFRSETDTPHYLAAFHLSDLSVVGGAAWKEAATTPWTARMRRHRTGLIRRGFVIAE